MAAQTLVWWDITKKVVELLRLHPAMGLVTVEPGWPGDRYRTDEMVWVFGIDGTEQIPVMQAGRKQRNDDFDITFEVSVAGRSDLDATVARTVEIVAAIQDVLADDPTLADQDGLLGAWISQKRLTVADVPLDEAGGLIGRAEVVVHCDTRLT